MNVLAPNITLNPTVPSLRSRVIVDVRQQEGA